MIFNLDNPLKVKMFGRVIQERGAWHNGCKSLYNIVLYCTQGSIHMEVGNSILHIHPTDLLLIPKNTFYKPLDGGSCQYLFFNFDAEPLPDEIGIPAKVAIAPHTKLKTGYAYTCTEDYSSFVKLAIHTQSASMRIPELFQKAELLRPNKNFADQLLLDNLLRELLIEAGKAASVKNNHHLSKIRTYIEHHYSLPLTLSSLSETFSLSQSYIARLFRIELAMKPSQYINLVRISAAKTMLSQTEMTIAEIGEAVGYSNIYYFSHIFKLLVGLSPSDFRNRN